MHILNALAHPVCSNCNDCYATQVSYGYGTPASSASSRQSYGSYYSYASPATPSPTPAPQLFGMQLAPAAYRPSAASFTGSSPYSPAPVATLRPSASSPASVPYYGLPAADSQSAPPATLFGAPRVSPPALGLSPYASPVAYGPNAYGAAPYSPASSPRASPYYGLPATGRKACIPSVERPLHVYLCSPESDHHTTPCLQVTKLSTVTALQLSCTVDGHLC